MDFKQEQPKQEAYDPFTKDEPIDVEFKEDVATQEQMSLETQENAGEENGAE